MFEGVNEAVRSDVARHPAERPVDGEQTPRLAGRGDHAARRLGRERRQRLAVSRDMPLLDAGTIDNPLIVRLEPHRRDIGVGHDVFRDSMTRPGDVGDRSLHAALPDVVGMDSESRRPISSVMPDS